MQYKYAILNIVIYNILSQTKRGISGALGIQQPYPYPLMIKWNHYSFFYLWLLTTANYAENHTRKSTETKDTAARIAVKKLED